MNAHAMTDLLRAIDVPRWNEGALCAQTDPELFFPEVGQTDVVREARQLCARCPLQQECREYAIHHGELHGIWGGTTDRERRRIRMERRRGAAA